MGAMHEFLKKMEAEEYRSIYAAQDELWNGRVQRLNQRLSDAGLPVRLANLQSIPHASATPPPLSPEPIPVGSCGAWFGGGGGISSRVFSANIRCRPIPTPSMTARSTAHPIAELRAARTPPRTASEPPVRKPAMTVSI